MTKPKILKDWPVEYPPSVLVEVEKVIKFARMFDINIEPFQRIILREILSERREVMVCIPKSNGKALALDTEIATPDGWTTMGDLQPGDQVFDETGKPCNVSFVTPVQHNRNCFEVEFSDGEVIVADRDHRWYVWDHWRQKSLVLTTGEMFPDHRTGKQRIAKYRVDNAAALDLPEADLPIDPYLLGAWLGDGASSSGAITFGEDDIKEELERSGYELSDNHARRFPAKAEVRTVYGLKAKLREQGVLENKHIPAAYFRGSYEQRLALIQGLMDTDGFVSKDQSQCEFVQKSKRLTEDLRELLATVGLKSTIKEKRARVYGKDCGTVYRLMFHGTTEVPVFKMARKVERLKTPEEGSGWQHQHKGRRIREIRPVESVPVKCIQVDSESHLYLAGRQLIPTHNTSLLAIVGLWHLLTHPEPEVYVGASSREQAGILWRFVCQFARRNPSIEKHLIIRHNIIRKREGEGFMKTLAADAPRSHGIGPTFAIVDELWAHRNPQVYVNFKQSLAKKNGKLVVLTTAGDDSSTTLAEMRKKALALPNKYEKGCLTFTYSDTANFSFFEWAVPKDGDFKDIDLVKEANPFSQVTKGFIREELESPGTPEVHFRQFRCNQWVESGEPWLPEGAWEDCYEKGVKIPDGAKVWAGLDIGYVHDSTALVLLYPREDGKTVAKAFFWHPKGDGTQLDLSIIGQKIRDLGSQYELQGVAYDPRFFVDTAQRLVDDGFPMMEFPQSDGRMIAATSVSYEAICAGQIAHDGDPELTRHILGATFKVRDSGFRLTKSKGKPNDGAIALAIGLRDMQYWGEESSVHKNPVLFLGFDDGSEGVDPTDEWFED